MHEGRPPFVFWTVVYVANLIVPGYLAMRMLEPPAVVGMIVGVIGLHVAGLWLGGQSPDALRVVALGGVVVAITQFAPMLQMFVGMIGVTAAGLVLPDEAVSPPILLPLFGLVATVVTGLGLLACAVTAGLPVLAAYRLSMGRSTGAHPGEALGDGEG